MNTPIDMVKDYLIAWTNIDYIGVFSVMQISTRFRMPVASFLLPFLHPPESFDVMDDETPKGLDGTVIRDVNIKIDLGKGLKIAKLRCVCEKVEGGVKTDRKIIPASTPDGGRWGVNLNSLRFDAD